MSSTNFVNGTVVQPEWLNDADAVVYEDIHMLQYGGAADGVTDCTAAIRDAFNALITRIAARADTRGGGRLILPSGSIRITDELDFFRASSPRVDIEIVGQGQLSTQILVDFYGAGKSVFKSIDPVGTGRSSPVCFKGFRMDNVDTTGGINPVFINVLGWSEASMEDVRFGGSNNTHVRAVSPQNCRIINVNSYGGGRSFNYKRTGSLTFTVNTGTNTITSSSAIFSAGDVGKYFFVFPPDATRRIRYQIATFVNSTNVTYADPRELAQTSVPGWFEPARCTITNGSTTLTANSACFTSDMVGLVIYIRTAAAGAYGKGLLRATITGYTSTTQVTLDTAATATATDAFFSVAAMDFGLAAGFDGSSDVKAFALRIEHYLGVGMVVQNTDAWSILGSKMHGSPTVTDDALSMAAMWLDDFGGVFQGDLDTTCSMSDWRVHWCNANDSTKFGLVDSRGIINGKIFGSDLVTSPDGYLGVESLTSYVDATDPYDLISDANFTADATDSRIILNGLVNMIGDSQKARYYVGKNTYFTPSGTIAGKFGAFDVEPISKPTVTGSRASGAALVSLLTKLAALGLVVDGTTA